MSLYLIFISRTISSLSVFVSLYLYLCLCLSISISVSPRPHPSDYDVIDINPFVIRPAEFQLMSGDSIDLEVLFTPEGSEEYKRKFVMVCDNCQVKIFTITGIGCNVEVEISAIDDRPIQYGAEKLVRPSHMSFRGLTPKATITRRLSVQNVTPLELNFQWLVKAPKENKISKHFDVSAVCRVNEVREVEG